VGGGAPWVGGGAAWVGAAAAWEGAAAAERQLRSLPDRRVEILELVAEDDRAVALVRLHGAQRGFLWGLPPTGRRVAVDGVEVFRLTPG